MTRLTALESGNVGLTALGPPQNIGRLLAIGRQLGRESMPVLTPEGPVMVATWPEWEMWEVGHA